MKRSRLYDCIAWIAIALPIALFFYRFVFPTSQLIITPDFGQSDSVTGISTKFLYSNALKSFTIPFWNSMIGGGYPAYANGGMGVWYLPNLLIYFFAPPSISTTLSLCVSLLLLAFGMYTWMRELRCSRIASVFGALSVSLSGYVIVQFTHVTIVQSLSLFPWIAVGCNRISTTHSWKAIVFVAFVYCQLVLLGFAQSIFITSLFMMGYTYYIGKSNSSILRSYTLLFVSMALGIGLSAIQLIPALEYKKQLQSSGIFSPEASTVFSYPFSHVRTLLYPYALGNPATGTYPHFFAFNGSIFWENTAFIGILPLLLCFWSMWQSLFLHRKNNTHVHFFYILALCAFFLMTGRNSPLYFIFSFYPFTLFRVPSRFIWLFIVALIAVASISLTKLLSYIQSQRERILLGTFLIMVQILGSFYYFSGYHNLEPATQWLSPPSFTQYLTQGYTYTIGGERAYNAAYLEHGWSTEDPKDRPSYILRNTFTPDKNSLWGVYQQLDYIGRSQKRSSILRDLVAQSISTNAGGYATMSATGTKVLSLLGVSNIISTLQLTASGLLQKAVLSDLRTQITLFINPASVPRAYIATDIQYATTLSQATTRILSDEFVIGTSALLESPIQASFSATPSVLRIISQKNGSYAFEVSPSAHEQLLVLADNYYPGWRAKIDGKDTATFPVNITQIGVIIPTGAKHITIFFIPTNFKAASWISFGTMCFIMFVTIFRFFGARVRDRKKIPGHASDR